MSSGGRAYRMDADSAGLGGKLTNPLNRTIRTGFIVL
jgi:hypothetical protein